MSTKTKHSAGILLYRLRDDRLEVLLIHMGGPFWAKKDLGAWSIPKGESDEGEDKLACACREFKEETGAEPGKKFIELSPVKQKSGKTIHVWASEGDFDLVNFKSNSFEMEWPPRSGKLKTFPEADRAQWFSIDEAIKKIVAGQAPFLRELHGRF